MAAEQKAHRQQRNRERAARLHDGVYGVIQLLTGRAHFIRRQNAGESYEEYQQYKREREKLIEQHEEERRESVQRIEALRTRHRAERMQLAERMAFLLVLEDGQQARERGQGPPQNLRRIDPGPSLEF